ncbi:MAG: hypothetical protein WD939_06135 [Dehalococcoidia bacterium]
MPRLPRQVQKRLASEFRFAASKIAEAGDIAEKMYYFSVFFGEAGRQLNVHWDTDLSLLHVVVQAACNQIGARAQIPQRMPTGGFPDGFLPAIDDVSQELAAVFEDKELDAARFYAAVSRVAELMYLVGGNGIYLHEKGALRL